ncbi:MAG: hypothetical protein ABR550_05040 [Wenzhouxiangellaceae bacterium]
MFTLRRLENHSEKLKQRTFSGTAFTDEGQLGTERDIQPWYGQTKSGTARFEGLDDVSQ